jgi:alginate O-acetyltransferase complex protein AlgI
MLFHSAKFLFLLILTLIIYYRYPKSRLVSLAIANAIFYGAGGAGYLLLFFIISFATYFCARKVNGEKGSFYFWLGIGLNLFNLLFFKYSLFMARNLERFVGISLLSAEGLLANLILPIGISFYTFQLIAYLVDVRREEIEPCDSFLIFWVFISFFAQLIAGPIMRGEDLIPQIEGLQKQRFANHRFGYGLYLMGLGLVKKVVFADLLSLRVDAFFSSAVYLDGFQSWLAAYLFAFQIYFDFSAYSDIALGIGHLFGIKLTNNFASPYLSGNPTDFWRRWHITLSNWIRDYLYIPLGGGRKGFPRQLLYLFIAMTISGLWHGAAWTFLIWGSYHGLLVVLHKVYGRVKKKLGFYPERSLLYRLVSVFVFFHLTGIGWVFFRAQGLTAALMMIRKMVFPGWFVWGNLSASGLGLTAVFYLLHWVEHQLKTKEGKLSRLWQNRFPVPLRALVYTGVLAVIILFTRTEQSSFIYFQF